LLVVGAGTVGAIHSVLPDHWVPLAVVARAQNWTLLRLTRVSALAAAGHVVTSLAMGAVVALIGLQFRNQIETQQGHIVGGVLVITGLGFLVWGVTGHGHPHDHGSEHPTPIRAPSAHNNEESQPGGSAATREQLDDQKHRHRHEPGLAMSETGSHIHEHAHGSVRHTHRHSHEAFVQARAELIAAHSSRGTLLGHLAAIAVPFGAAASPDLTFLPLAIGATAFGVGAVGAVLGVFAVVTMITFVGLTVGATAVGYQMRGEWLEKNASSITAIVLIGIGVVVYRGL